MNLKTYLKSFIAVLIVLYGITGYAKTVKPNKAVESEPKPVTMEEVYQYLLKNPPTFETTHVFLGKKAITIEIADTLTRQLFGLMARTSLPKDTGMLFVFKESIPLCFWMKSTPLPLSVGFIDEQGYLINIKDMEPLSETQYCSDKPAQYALEMAQGWFTENKIAIGDKLTMPNSSSE